MRDYIYKSYVKCESAITEALHLIKLEKYQYKRSATYQKRLEELYSSKEYKRQTKREKSALTSIYWYCFKQLTDTVMYPIIWDDKVYHKWDTWPVAAQEYTRNNRIRLPRIGITAAAFYDGKIDQYAINYYIEQWKKENNINILPWEFIR